MPQSKEVHRDYMRKRRDKAEEAKAPVTLRYSSRGGVQYRAWRTQGFSSN